MKKFPKKICLRFNGKQINTVSELSINFAGILGEFHRILVRIPEEFDGFSINSYTLFFVEISKIKEDN